MSVTNILENALRQAVCNVPAHRELVDLLNAITASGDLVVGSVGAGYVDGLDITRVDAATIRIGAGRCADEDGDKVIEVVTPLDVDLTALGPLGIDVGVEAISKLYTPWLLEGDLGVTAVVSESQIAPATQAGYDDRRRRLWSCAQNNSSGDLSTFVVGGEGRLRSVAIDYDTTDQVIISGGVAAVPTTLSMTHIVPLDAILASMRLNFTPLEANNLFGVAPTGHSIRFLRGGVVLPDTYIVSELVPLNGDASIDYQIITTGASSLTIAIESFMQAI